MTGLELERAENEIRARKSDGKHQTRIAVVSILLGSLGEYSGHCWHIG